MRADAGHLVGRSVVHKVGEAEILHLAREVCAARGRVEVGDRTDPALAARQPLPDALDIAAQRRDPAIPVMTTRSLIGKNFKSDTWAQEPGFGHRLPGIRKNQQHRSITSRGPAELLDPSTQFRCSGTSAQCQMPNAKCQVPSAARLLSSSRQSRTSACLRRARRRSRRTSRERFPWRR